jgi:hypothetical protein
MYLGRVRPDEVRNGDTIKVTRTIRVKDAKGRLLSVSDDEGKVWSLDGADIDITDRPSVNPDQWPPENGDVWRSGRSRREYFIRDGKPVTSGYSVITTIEALKDSKPELVHRNENPA